MEQEFRHCVREARKRGQTVFLSSHVLSEVEALCDRVAILREGRLVESGNLSEMRHLSAVSVEATLVGSVPDLSAVPGVSGLVIDGHSLRCHVQGSIEPLLQCLAQIGVTRFISREPSLEELFLVHYGNREARAEASDVVG